MSLCLLWAGWTDRTPFWLCPFLTSLSLPLSFCCCLSLFLFLSLSSRVHLSLCLLWHLSAWFVFAPSFIYSVLKVANIYDIDLRPYEVTAVDLICLWQLHYLPRRSASSSRTDKCIALPPANVMTSLAFASLLGSSRPPLRLCLFRLHQSSHIEPFIEIEVLITAQTNLDLTERCVSHFPGKKLLNLSI